MPNARYFEWSAEQLQQLTHGSTVWVYWSDEMTELVVVEKYNGHRIFGTSTVDGRHLAPYLEICNPDSVCKPLSGSGGDDAQR